MASIEDRGEFDQELPDLAAREPAEGDMDFPESQHLQDPNREPSSELPTEGGAFAPEKKRR